ncbi:MAG TPA: arylesterase [Gallionellaceae bacterium]
MKLSVLLKFAIVLLCLLPALGFAQPTIMVFGDSLSAGYGVPRKAAWVSLLQQQLQRSHPQYRVVNTSISGETTSGGVERMAAALRQHKPTIVIIELGANDGLRGTPLKVTEKNLDTLIRQAQAAKCKVLLLGMQLPPNYGIEYTARFRSLYSRLAERHQVALVPFLLQGVPPEQFQADNLHPTAEAQPLILQTVLRKLQPLL